MFGRLRYARALWELFCRSWSRFGRVLFIDHDYDSVEHCSVDHDTVEYYKNYLADHDYDSVEYCSVRHDRVKHWAVKNDTVEYCSGYHETAIDYKVENYSV